MKKITLLAALLVGAVSFSQTTIIDRVPDHGSGLISTQGDDGTGVYGADYFVLNTKTTLEDFTAYGFPSQAPLGIWVEGFNVAIYTHNGTKPAGYPHQAGTGLEFFEIAPGDFTLDETTQAHFTVNFTQLNGGTPITLAPGEYWITAFPNVIGGPNDTGRWNWLGSASSAPAHEPVLLDPADLFGAGATDWTNISGLIGESFPAFGWTLTGSEVIGVGENLAEMVSIYPNPTTDILNIQVPSSVEITSVAMYDVLGKRVSVSYANNVIDTANLSTGVYMLKVETSAGALTQKIVKQ